MGGGGGGVVLAGSRYRAPGWDLAPKSRGARRLIFVCAGRVGSSQAGSWAEAGVVWVGQAWGSRGAAPRLSVMSGGRVLGCGPGALGHAAAQDPALGAWARFLAELWACSAAGGSQSWG